MAQQPLLVEKQRYTNVCFTWSNYTPSDEEKLKKVFDEQFPLKVKFMQYGHELAGTTGTPHLQGFIQFGGRYTLATIQKCYGYHAHWEICRGSLQDNLDYTSKEQRDIVTVGEPHPMDRADQGYGQRKEFREAVDKATNMQQLAQSFRSTFIQYHKGFQALFAELRKAEPKVAPRIIWLAGPTGCGKTRTAYEEGLALGRVAIIADSTLQWFNPYDGSEDVVILNDFRAAGCRFQFLLNVTDRYPMVVPVKGDFVPWNPKVIYFTCPNEPEMEFINHQTNQQYENLNQLLRRICEIRTWDPIMNAWRIRVPREFTDHNQ